MQASCSGSSVVGVLARCLAGRLVQVVWLLPKCVRAPYPFVFNSLIAVLLVVSVGMALHTHGDDFQTSWPVFGLLSGRNIVDVMLDKMDPREAVFSPGNGRHNSQLQVRSQIKIQ